MPLGSDIAAARRSAGLDLEAVAEATRLRRTVLEAIEHDDFSLCGGDVYARGHLRSIARSVGADPIPWIEAFDRDHAVPTEDPVTALEAGDVQPAPRGPNWTAAMAAALAIVVGLGVWSVLGDEGAAPTATPPAAQGAAEPTLSAPREPTQAPATQAAPPVVDPEDEAVASVDEVTATLRIQGDRSWVAVSGADGSTLFEGVLEDGDRRSFSDPQELRLVLGNAGAVLVTANGQDQGRAGDAGQVVRLTIGPGDGGGS